MGEWYFPYKIMDVIIFIFALILVNLWRSIINDHF